MVMQRFFIHGNFITNFSHQAMGLDKTSTGVSFPAFCFSKRLEEGSNYPMLKLWSNETLVNVILSNKSYILRELFSLGYTNLDSLTNKDLLELYFCGSLKRCMLEDYIMEMIRVEKDLSSDHQTPIGSLMCGVFYINGYLRKTGTTWVKSVSNFEFLSGKDLNRLRIMYGLNQQSSNSTLVENIIHEQNTFVEELINNNIGNSSYLDGIKQKSSVIKIIINVNN